MITIQLIAIATSDSIAAVRSAVTGMANGPDVVQMLTCLGQDRVVGRLKSGFSDK